MLDSVPFPQHFPTKSTLCGPKLMCFRNPNSWPCFSQAYVSSCEWVGVKTTPREEEGRPAAATPSHGTDVRLPGCVDRESRRTISRSVVWRDGEGRAQAAWVSHTLSGDWDLYPDGPPIWAHFTDRKQREVREKSFRLVPSLERIEEITVQEEST